MMKKTLLALTVLTTLAAPAMAQEAGSWVLRTSIANVSPNDESGAVLGNDGVSVDSATGLGISLTYMVDNNWGVEVLAASPFSHTIDGTGNLAGLNIGKTKQLPPTVSAIYQWGSETKYHVGVGLNHTVFFDTNTSDALTSALGANSTDLDLESSTGLAFKIGFDMPVSKDWSFSGNIYYADIDTKGDVIVNGAVATTVDVQIDPVVYMLGFSTQF